MLEYLGQVLERQDSMLSSECGFRSAEFKPQMGCGNWLRGSSSRKVLGAFFLSGWRVRSYAIGGAAKALKLSRVCGAKQLEQKVTKGTHNQNGVYAKRADAGR